METTWNWDSQNLRQSSRLPALQHLCQLSKGTFLVNLHVPSALKLGSDHIQSAKYCTVRKHVHFLFIAPMLLQSRHRKAVWLLISSSSCVCRKKEKKKTHKTPKPTPPVRTVALENFRITVIGRAVTQFCKYLKSLDTFLEMGALMCQVFSAWGCLKPQFPCYGKHLNLWFR